MSALRLTAEQRLDWLQLIRCDNIGPRTFRTLLNRFGGAAGALEALPSLIRQGKGRAIIMASRDAAKREMDVAQKAGARFIALGEADYPAGLRAIDAPPPLIAVKGDVSVFQRPMAALVGSRNASAAGLAMTEKLARGLAASGYVLVAGLARGVDASAHRASLAKGGIGVLAGGLDKPYPPEHVGLIAQLTERGAVISEMPFGYEPRGRDFPRRNRLVAGLALGVVVTEAARRSGSLITARFAQEMGRELFAVPGSPLDPRAEGANDLLRQGAHMCCSAQDVIEILAPLAARGVQRYDMLFEPAPIPYEEPLWDEAEDLLGDAPTFHDFPLEPVAPVPVALVLETFVAAEPPLSSSLPPLERVAALLGPAPIGVDELARASAVTVAELRLILEELDLDGRIERHGGDRVSLIEDWRN